MSKSVVVKPLDAALDLRSEPEDVLPGGARWRLNWTIKQKGRPCRATGWSRLLETENNHDLHSQLLDLTLNAARKPITFLFEGESTLRTTMLFSGTADALYQLNVGTGNWRVLSSVGNGGFGGFKQAAQTRDTVVFTNDHDQVQYWIFDSEPVLAPVPDLVTLGISKVGVVKNFRGFVFYMNYVKNGFTVSDGIIWSDFENALSINPTTESLAFRVTLGPGESILAAEELANVLIIYTTKGIWQGVYTGADNSIEQGPVFVFSKRYAAPTKKSVLAYPRTLVSVGDSHLYASQTAVLEYSLYTPEPKVVDWIDKASIAMFDELEPDDCVGPVAGFNSTLEQVWMSWPNKNAEGAYERTLIFSTKHAFVSLIDHGFTAFVQFQPRTNVTVLRDWLQQVCICTPEQLEEFFPDQFASEGGYCETPDLGVVCETQPDAFYTTETVELEDDIVMEDFDAEEPSGNSLCSRLAGVSLADLCVEESQRDQCNASRLFVMASAEDYALKQSADVYYREKALTFGACGTYATEGYLTVLRSGPMAFREVDAEKRLERFMVEGTAVEAAVPGYMQLRIGAAEQAVDPNQDCGIIWFDVGKRSLECPSASQAAHEAANTRPDIPFEWPVFAQGRNLFYELTIGNDESTPVNVGAAACFSKFVMDVTAVKRRY